MGGPGRDVRAVMMLPPEKRKNEADDNRSKSVEDQVRVGFDSGDVLVGGGGGGHASTAATAPTWSSAATPLAGRTPSSSDARLALRGRWPLGRMC